MGSIVSKNKNRKKKKKKKSSCGPCEEVEYMRLREKLKLLQGEIHEIKHLREKECQAQKQQVKNYARKEAEWKGERKKLRDEVRRLRTELMVAKDHQEMTINHQGMLEDGEDGIFAGGINILDSQEYWQWQLMGQGSNFLVQHMREEQARRDEAVQKWKKLYLSIKTELDTLIHRAHQGDGLYLREEEDTIRVLKTELKGKEETIQDLKARVAVMEKEGIKKEREIDILRQSLRIMSSKRKGDSCYQGSHWKLAHVN
ncbi:uncharacterized protein LOC122088404 [Macadamia integrifolia]|uniref:uncharacterized protein LOC122088404 n=1 Tax=Macadamia integrifolia TaxID=60698 RepID=UPI001C4F6D4B|nr:uncharacterized protein LOC122088404 [Macadamia integrifolia]